MSFLFGWLITLAPLFLVMGGAASWILIRGIGHYIGLGLLVAAGVLFGFNTGQDAARGECKSAELQRKIEILEADRDRALKAREAGERIKTVDASELADVERRENELLGEIAKEKRLREDAEREADRIAAIAAKPVEPVNGKCPAPPVPAPVKRSHSDGGATLDDLRGLRRFGPD